MDVLTYICVYIHTHAYIYVCAYVYVPIDACVYVCGKSGLLLGAKNLLGKMRLIHEAKSKEFKMSCNYKL